VGELYARDGAQRLPGICLPTRVRWIGYPERETDAALYRYVFDNYTWEREGPDIVEFEGKLRPGRIPLSAYIAGMRISSIALYPWPQLLMSSRQDR
jgi:hypothetical protein